MTKKAKEQTTWFKDWSRWDRRRATQARVMEVQEDPQGDQEEGMARERERKESNRGGNSHFC